ncbi:uncharacterized protein LODBEIA_P38130 [Lodderomyces beijingensis]|uniref:EF-hand domain-containing protein n=1 Tax=Lodderomyces beijingensis TaxID=1775926 RepID=A0ABP0ZNX6_9ASCO
MNDLPQMPTPYQQHQHQHGNKKPQQQQYQDQQQSLNGQKISYRPPPQQVSSRTGSQTFQQPPGHVIPQQQPQYQYQPAPNPDYSRQQQQQQRHHHHHHHQQQQQQVSPQPLYQQQPPPPQQQHVYQPMPQPQPPLHMQPSYSQSPPAHPGAYNPQASQSLNRQYQSYSQSGQITNPQQFDPMQQEPSGVSKKPPPPSSSSSQQTIHSPPIHSSKPSNRSKESLATDKSLTSKQKLGIELRSVFEKVDVNKSGKISAKELSYALLNFDHTRFQESTIKLMLNLFTNRNDASSSSSSSTPSYNSNKSLNFEQFVSLWKYLSAYKKLFIQADSNKSGDISFGEFQKILEQIGYKLDIDLVLHLFSKYSVKDDGQVGRLKFDSFIELLVYLRKLTDIFKKYDKSLSGTATIGFSDFLFEISNMT